MADRWNFAKVASATKTGVLTCITGCCINKDQQANLAPIDNTERKQNRESSNVVYTAATGLQENQLNLTDRGNCFTERKKQTTMVAESMIRANFMGLRTVPVILKNGERSLK